MKYVDFVAEIEADYTWRLDEIRFHFNVIDSLSEDDANRMRRAALLMIYAHFEGYAKFCFEHFVSMLNSLSVKCGDVKYPIAASTLYKAFEDLNRDESKSKIFINPIPEDKRLRRLSRQSEVLQRISVIDNQLVKLPDEIANTESNLSSSVLRKLLFEVGLDYKRFDHLEQKISRLLHLRNGIAHGSSKFKRIIHLSDYNILRDAALHIMQEIKSSLVAAIRDSEYLRVASMPDTNVVTVSESL